MVRVLLAIALTAGAPVAHHTSPGTTAARASLLTAADFGKGWSAAKAAQRGILLSCPGHAPSAKGIVETGVAASPTFSAAQTGPFVQQNTSVYATAAQASTWWSRAVTPSLSTCVADDLAALAARGVKVKLDSAGKLAVTTTAAHTAGYRVVATANGKKLYLDVIVIGSGATITDITISSFIAPVPAKTEQALAKVVARKLGGPSA
jgi:hypothetical protein